MIPEDVEVTDAHLQADQARARGLVLARLEQLWKATQPHVDGTILEEGGRVDPRMVKIGLDVLDRLHRLYRLDVPVPAAADPEAAAVADRAAVEESLRELEARIKPEAQS